MAEVLPDNGLTTTLSGSVTNTATTVPIQATDAPIWPASGEYRAVLWADPIAGPWEVIRVTGGQGTANLIVQRAAESYHGSQTARAWPVGTYIAAVLTKAGLNGVISQGDATQAPTVYSDDLVPAGGTNTLFLSHAPRTVFMVARNGVIQSQGAGHYTVSGSQLTFSATFTGGDRVIVSYTG